MIYKFLTGTGRLPQHLLYRKNAKVNGPIIFKLGSNYDKQLVANSLKHL